MTIQRRTHQCRTVCDRLELSYFVLLRCVVLLHAPKSILIHVFKVHRALTLYATGMCPCSIGDFTANWYEAEQNMFFDLIDMDSETWDRGPRCRKSTCPIRHSSLIHPLEGAYRRTCQKESDATQRFGVGDSYLFCLSYVSFRIL